MNDDIEMDAPQISTLREEETPEPPPTPARTSKFRVKLLVGNGPSSSGASSRKQTAQPDSEEEDEDEEDEEEEDQLIDDDDDDIRATVPASAAASAAPTARSSPAKRGTGRGRGGGAGGGAAKRKAIRTGETEEPLVQGWTAQADASGASASAPPLVKKKGPAKGAQRAIKKRPTKKTAASLLREEVGSISDAYAATAASSPMPQDEHSPEPDLPAPPIPAVSTDDPNLDGFPLPRYPLPSKPFPVQPPIKIGSGFAPVMPLDKSGKPVRRWRRANREIRGIAGGRWFFRSWIGEKESEYASATAAAVAATHHAAQAAAEQENASNSVALPKLSGTGKGVKRKAAKLDGGPATGPSSRAASTVPESISVHIPAKKRNTGNGQGMPSGETVAASAPVT